MIRAKFFASETEIFLVLSNDRILYITSMNSSTKFFDCTIKIKLQNQSFIQNFDGAIFTNPNYSEHILIVIGHYDGLYSFVQRNFDEEFVETKMKISNHSNYTPFQHFAVLQVYLDHSYSKQLRFCISHANGIVNIFNINCINQELNLKLEHSIVTNYLPLDVFLYEKTLIIATKGSIQVFGGIDFSITKTFSTFAESIICSLLILKEKSSSYSIYFGDEKGRIFEMSQKEKSNHEVIEVIGELNSFIVGCGMDKKNGKIIFYDRLNSCTYFE